MSCHRLALSFRAWVTVSRTKAVATYFFVGIILFVVLQLFLDSLLWIKHESWISSPHREVPLNCCLTPSSDCSPRAKRLHREKPLQIVGLGENVKVGEATEVHVMSAIKRGDYPLAGRLNVILLTWTGSRKEDKHSFVCCLTSAPDSHDVIQVPAKLLLADPIKNEIKLHLFGCSLTNQSYDATTLRARGAMSSQAELRYVAFADQSCDVRAMTSTAHELVEPPDGQNKYAVCVGYAYGQLDPAKLVEWFEFSRIVGVSVVQVFYHIVNEEAMKVFRYYEEIGFLILAPVTPAALKGHPPRGIPRPRAERQAWSDKTLLVNACMHLLSKYDFVGVQDFDELLVPSPPFNTLPEVLKDARARNPRVAVFTVDTYIVMTDWPESEPAAPISFLRRLDRTVSDTLDNKGVGKSSPKIIFRPLNVLGVATHSAFKIKPGYKSKPLPKKSHTFLHYRSCKPALWKGCKMKRVRDESLLRFQTRWVQAVDQLPLVKLGCSEGYAKNIYRMAKTLKQATSVGN